MILTLSLLSTVTRLVAGLFALGGVMACLVLVIRAMGECESVIYSENTKDKSRKPQKEGRREDHLDVPRYIPRLFLSSYILIIVSYILQVIDLSVHTIPHPDAQKWNPNTTAILSDHPMVDTKIYSSGKIYYLDLLLNCATTIFLIGLPIYHRPARRLVRYSLSNDLTRRGRGSKRADVTDSTSGGDRSYECRYEGDAEGGWVEEEMRRDLRVIMNRSRRRKTV